MSKDDYEERLVWVIFALALATFFAVALNLACLISFISSEKGAQEESCLCESQSETEVE